MQDPKPGLDPRYRDRAKCLFLTLMVNPFLLSSSRNFFLLISLSLPTSWMSLTRTKSHFSSSCHRNQQGINGVARGELSMLQPLGGLGLDHEAPGMGNEQENGDGETEAAAALALPLSPLGCAELAGCRGSRTHQGGGRFHIFHGKIPPGSQQDLILGRETQRRSQQAPCPGTEQTSPCGCVRDLGMPRAEPAAGIRTRL